MESQKIQEIEEMIKHRYGFNSNSNLNTPLLHMAVANNDIDTIKLLVEVLQVDVNIKDAGYTAPYYACLLSCLDANRMEVVRYLVGTGKAIIGDYAICHACWNC
jgi:ankyrin repeat protein